MYGGMVGCMVGWQDVWCDGKMMMGWRMYGEMAGYMIWQDLWWDGKMYHGMVGCMVGW
jgi:hypothetical protein